MADANQTAVLCTDCDAILDRLDKLLYTENDEYDNSLERLIPMPFKSLDAVRLSSAKGCKICGFIASVRGRDRDGSLKLASPCPLKSIRRR